MDDEKLFEMLDSCIARAVKRLENGVPLEPFAMTLEADDAAVLLDLGEADAEKHYDMLIEALRAEAQHGQIKAVAILARVTIPDHFAPEVPEGIRIHVEERAASQANKIAARLLYIPYRLYRSEKEETIRVHLHNPIPVGFPSEIFV